MSRMIFIGNIPFGSTEEQLRDVFEEVGQVKHLRLVFDRVTGKPKGFGFCEYFDVETAASAVRNLNGVEVGDRRLRVKIADEDIGDDNQIGDMGGGGSNSGNGSSSGRRNDNSSVSATDQITNTLASYSTPELLNVLKDMKAFIVRNPEESKSYLTSNPQVTYTIFQALLLTNLITPEMIGKYFSQQSGGSSVTSSAAAPSAEQMALAQKIMSMTVSQIDALPPAQKAQILNLKAQLEKSMASSSSS